MGKAEDTVAQCKNEANERPFRDHRERLQETVQLFRSPSDRCVSGKQRRLNYQNKQKKKSRK